MTAVDYVTKENGARTNTEQRETASEFRVSFVSPRKRRLLFLDVDECGRPCAISFNPEGMNDAEYLMAVHQMADDLEEDDVCYFVGGEEGPVKIGYAKNLRKRLGALQNGSPVILSVLASTTGGITRETAYHYQFARFRLHGEWFERSSEIVSEIERIRATAPA